MLNGGNQGVAGGLSLSETPPASAMCVDGRWKMRSEYEKTGKP